MPAAASALGGTLAADADAVAGDAADADAVAGDTVSADPVADAMEADRAAAANIAPAPGRDVDGTGADELERSVTLRAS
jgi:hypothetical protein